MNSFRHVSLATWALGLVGLGLPWAATMAAPMPSTERFGDRAFVAGQSSPHFPSSQLPSSQVPSPQLISQTFRPPKYGTPSETAGAGTRGTCAVNSAVVTPLVPQVTAPQVAAAARPGVVQSPPAVTSLTVSDRPTLFWHVSSTGGEQANFLLLNKSGTKVFYETNLTLPKTPSVMSVSLPRTAPALQVGQEYQWFLSVPCGPADRRHLRGRLVRVQPETGLLQRLARSTPQQQASALAEAGIWQDALMILAQLRQGAPQDARLQQSWLRFLSSGGLRQVASAPLIGDDVALSSQVSGQ